MKAYVIKDKKGKYLSSSFDYDGEPIFTDCIIDAIPYDDCDIVARVCPYDCEVVEITTVEGDLEQQIKEKDHRIAVLEKAFLNLCKDVYKIHSWFWKSPSEIETEYIKQAEKELEEKK